MNLADLMTRSIATVEPSTPLAEAAARMSGARISSVVAVDGGEAIGILTERDVLRAWSEGASGADPVRAWMSTPVVSAPAHTDWREALHTLSAARIRHLLVTDGNGAPAGIVSETDFRRNIGADLLDRLRDLTAVMATEVLMFEPDTPLEQMLRAMAGSRASCVVVAERGLPLGVFTERDAARLFARGAVDLARPSRDAMTAPALTVGVGEALLDAFARMHAVAVRQLVVVSAQGVVLGLLSEHSVVGLLEGQYLGELRAVRERALEARRESELRFEALFDAATILLGLLEPDGRLVKVNPAALDLIGARHEEVVGIPFADTPWWREDAEQRERVRAAVEAAGRGDAVRFEAHHPRADGGQVWVDFRLKPVRRAGGELAFLLAEGLDITYRKASEDALRRSESTYRGILNSIGEAVFVLDRDGRILDVNEVAVSLYGRARQDFIGHTPAFLGAPGRNDEGEVLRRMAEAFDGAPQRFEYWGRTARGRVFPKEVRLYAGEYFGAPAVIAVANDVTEKKRQEAQLRLAASVYENSSEAMMVTDPEGLIVAINPAFTALTGFAAEDVVGRDAALLGAAPASAVGTDGALERQGFWEGEARLRRRDGGAFDGWLNVSVVRDRDGRPRNFVSLFFDISDRKRQEEALWHEANYDALTGLPNRRLFRDRIQQDIKRLARSGGVLALLFIDLDRFKEVNDTLGHETGDRLLVEAARRISSTVRQSDTVARLGGDEFTVVLPSLRSSARADEVAQKILRALASPYQLGGETLYLSASVGITLFPGDGDDLEALLKHADQAMYAAKDAGRNCFRYFTSSMQREAQSRMQLGNDLRGALARGQLEVHYQPIVSLATGRARKVEALVRWRHPTRGLVPPAEFIPIAEELGLIHEIGDWVFHEAARAVRDRGDPELQVGINKSPRQFVTGATQERWIEHLEGLGLSPHAVVIEITEGLLLDDRPEVAEKLARFHECGVQFALDDFGTGYSAMSYLKRFRVDYLKIDRSFIGEMETLESDRAIVEAVVAMAHRLGILVIAEGVETEAQRRILVDAGCDFAQGFYFGRPTPDLAACLAVGPKE